MTRQVGAGGVRSTAPVGSGTPLAGSIRNVVIVSETWLTTQRWSPANRKSPRVLTANWNVPDQAQRCCAVVQGHKNGDRVRASVGDITELAVGRHPDRRRLAGHIGTEVGDGGQRGADLERVQVQHGRRRVQLVGHVRVPSTRMEGQVP